MHEIKIGKTFYRGRAHEAVLECVSGTRRPGELDEIGGDLSTVTARFDIDEERSVWLTLKRPDPNTQPDTNLRSLVRYINRVLPLVAYCVYEMFKACLSGCRPRNA